MTQCPKVGQLKISLFFKKQNLQKRAHTSLTVALTFYLLDKYSLQERKARDLIRAAMQILPQESKEYQSKNLVHDFGIFNANKVNFT